MDSARVRLEVAILAADEGAPAVATPPHGDGQGLTILVVVADADIRRYVLECLRDRRDVRVVAAATVAEALMLEARESPKLMVVDAPESEVLVALPHVRAVVIVDDVPRRDRPTGSRVRFLCRPFSAGALEAELTHLLA